MTYEQPHRVEAVILDWAGTVVDFGSFAPTQIFVEAFRECGVAISLEEARGPMGMGKRDHIQALLRAPGIAARYAAARGHTATEADIEAIYERFIPLQIEKIAEHSAPIPGAIEAIACLRARGIKIGSCSGYPARVMERVVALAARAGYVADCVVAADEVPRSRPAPAQALANAIALGIADVAACVKVDDTVPGIIEGRSAGMWTVALTCSGNAMGLTYESFRALTQEQLGAERTRVGEIFAASRPHVVLDTIVDLPNAIETIERWMRDGASPQAC